MSILNALCALIFLQFSSLGATAVPPAVPAKAPLSLNLPNLPTPLFKYASQTTSLISTRYQKCLTPTKQLEPHRPKDRNFFPHPRHQSNPQSPRRPRTLPPSPARRQPLHHRCPGRHVFPPVYPPPGLRPPCRLPRILWKCSLCHCKEWCFRGVFPTVERCGLGAEGACAD